MSAPFVIPEGEQVLRPRQEIPRDHLYSISPNLTEKDRRLAEFLYNHRFATRYQLERLFFRSREQCRRRLKYLDRVRIIAKYEIKAPDRRFNHVYALDIAGALYLRAKWNPESNIQSIQLITKYLQLAEVTIRLMPGLKEYAVSPVFETGAGLYRPMALFDHRGDQIIWEIYRPGEEDSIRRKIKYLEAFLLDWDKFFARRPQVVLNCADDNQITFIKGLLEHLAKKVHFTTDESFIKGSR